MPAGMDDQTGHPREVIMKYFNVTFDELAAEVKRLAAERPHFTYPDSTGGCTYVDETEDLGYYSPPCLFGQSLLNLGIPDVVLRGEGNRIRTVMQLVGITFKPQEGNWASMVQSEQDSGVSWGEVIAGCESYFPND